MNKILLIGILSLFLIGIVYAGTIALSNTKSLSIDNTPKIIPEKQLDTITFDCDGTSITIEGSEPDGKYDMNDMVSLVSSNCTGMATDIEINSVAIYEFNGEIGAYALMKEKECLSLNGVYDSGKDSCLEIEENLGLENT